MTVKVETGADAALFMREIGLEAGLETFIIALFVIAGVKVASIISNWLQWVKL